MFGSFFYNSKSSGNNKVTSYTSYIPGADWISSKLNSVKKLYNALPVIGLTGRGFTINGYAFSLDNIPTNISKAFGFCAALTCVVKAQAQEVFFTDPSGKTYYEFNIEHNYGCIDSKFFTNVVQSCNATEIFRDIGNSINIFTASKCGGDNSIVAYLNLNRAADNASDANFEKCIIDGIKNRLAFSWMDVLYTLVAVAGIGVVICLGAYCHRKHDSNGTGGRNIATSEPLIDRRPADSSTNITVNPELPAAQRPALS